MDSAHPGVKRTTLPHRHYGYCPEGKTIGVRRYDQVFELFEYPSIEGV